MRAPTYTPEALNLEGQLPVFVTNDFGLMVVRDTPDDDVSRVALEGCDVAGDLPGADASLPVPHTISTGVNSLFPAVDGTPVFVDLRDTAPDTVEKYWLNMAVEGGSQYWQHEADAYEELKRAAKSSALDQLTADALARRGLYAIAETRMAVHMNRKPEETEHVGFDPRLFPFRRMRIEAGATAGLKGYMVVASAPGGKYMTWDDCHRLYPQEWSE